MNWAQHPPNPLRRGVITMKYSFILNGEVLYTLIYMYILGLWKVLHRAAPSFFEVDCVERDA